MTDRQRLSFASGLLSIWLFASTGSAKRLNHNSYLGKSPPEIAAQQHDWLGWDENVTLADLRGKVVWLQFNFLENCISLRPHLVKWEEQYSDDGLVVVEINRCIGEPLEVMRCMVESQQLKHPVLWDAECRNTNAYGVSAWPFAYLIGTDGRVFWEGNPSRWIHCKQKADEMRACFEKELDKANESSISTVAAKAASDVARP